MRMIMGKLNKQTKTKGSLKVLSCTYGSIPRRVCILPPPKNKNPRCKNGKKIIIIILRIIVKIPLFLILTLSLSLFTF